jgi:hypothetical protein
MKIVEALKKRPRVQKTSLEQVLRDILAAAAKPSRTEVIAEINALRKKIGPISGDSTALIREDRDNDKPYR